MKSNLVVVLLFALLLAWQGPEVNSSAVRMVKRVAVVGGGTGGLGIALALQRMDPCVEEVCIFEKRDSVLQPSLGGGVQLSGGAKVLERLGYLTQLNDVAERLTGVLSRNARAEQLLCLDVDALVRKRASDVLCGPNGSPVTYSIMRDALQQLLWDATQSQREGLAARVTAHTGDGVVAIREDASTCAVELEFESGRRLGSFDMVVGADGIQSTVRSHTTHGNTPLLPIAGLEPGLRYTGTRITFATTDADPSFLHRPCDARGKFHQWFGNGCYALSASYGGKNGVQHMLALVRASARDADLRENSEWTSSSAPASSAKDETRLRLAQGGLGDNTDLSTLLEACTEDSFIDLGVRDRSLPLKSWTSTSGRIVLLGDSAHAMAPFLGQGANQALQDAYSLAYHIARFNSPSHSRAQAAVPLQRFMAQYERERKAPTAMLSLTSNFLGYVETLSGAPGQALRDSFFRTMTHLGVVDDVFLAGATPNVAELRDYRDGETR